MRTDLSIVATIIAIEERREMADRIHAAVSASFPSAIFYAAPPYSSRNALLLARTAVEYAAAIPADWHLFLEDDQALYPALWTLLPQLLASADTRGIEAFYLSNRKITYAAQELIGGCVMNRIVQPVHGSHGLLYRTRHIPAWLSVMQGDCALPVDDTFWLALPPATAPVYQIVAPILAQHLGVRSTLSRYEADAHLLLNGLEPGCLTPSAR